MSPKSRIGRHERRSDALPGAGKATTSAQAYPFFLVVFFCFNRASHGV
jgi:hypothetical protein